MEFFSEIKNFQQGLNTYDINNNEKKETLDKLLKKFCDLKINLKIMPEKCSVCMVCKKPFENNDIPITLACSCFQRVHKKCLEIKMEENFFSILSCVYCGTPISEQILRDLKQKPRENSHHRVKIFDNLEKKTDECSVCKKYWEKSKIYEFKCRHKICLKCFPIFLDYQLQTNDINEINCPQINCFVKIIDEEMIQNLFICFEELKNCQQIYMDKKKNHQAAARLQKTQSEQVLKRENFLKHKSESIRNEKKRDHHHQKRKKHKEGSCLIQ